MIGADLVDNHGRKDPAELEGQMDNDRAKPIGNDRDNPII